MSSGFKGTESLFDLAPHFFNRIEIRRVGGKEPGTGTACLNESDSLFILVRGEIVHHHDVSCLQSREEHFTHVGAEDFRVRGSIDGHTSRRTIQAHGGDHGRRAPMTMGGGEVEPLSPCTSAAQACHVGLGRRLVQEHEPSRVYAPLLAAPPCAGLGHIVAPLLAGMESLFLYESPMSSKT